MTQGEPVKETYNPWTIVNLVFTYLADQGLHPTFSDAGDPGSHAADMLRAMGIEPSKDGDARISQNVRDQLAELRAAFDER